MPDTIFMPSHGDYITTAIWAVAAQQRHASQGNLEHGDAICRRQRQIVSAKATQPGSPLKLTRLPTRGFKLSEVVLAHIAVTWVTSKATM